MIAYCDFEDPEEWITNLDRLRQRIAECGKTVDDNKLVMHVLYHLPIEYNTINDQYLKDLDDEKDVGLEDLRANLQRKYDRLVDWDVLRKIMTTEMTNLLRKKKH